MSESPQHTQEQTLEQTLKTHYRRLAQDYDNFLYYSPDFVRALTSKMLEKLDLGEDDVFVDLGGGTGMYSLDILQQVPLANPVICVDPFQEMLDRIPVEAPIEGVCQDALSFTAQPGQYDKVLIKEAVHHIPERRELFANLHERLSPGGRLLLVHVPPEVQYPLFRKALERCKSWHAHPDELVELLQETGYQVERDGLDYQHELPKEHYFRMVAGQYMSVLSSFSEGEIALGLAEMERTYEGDDVLRFVDHFDFITARKV